MIQPPLLGVVNAASAVSARTLTWRAPSRAAELLDAVRGRRLPNRLTVSGVPSRGDGEGESRVRTSMLSRSV
jgi:hypothetical protein